jgi:hypothetical protein
VQWLGCLDGAVDDLADACGCLAVPAEELTFNTGVLTGGLARHPVTW